MSDFVMRFQILIRIESLGLSVGANPIAVYLNLISSLKH